MTPRQNGFFFCFCLLTLLVLTSCATTSSQSFMLAFLPPAPGQRLASAPALEAPAIPANLYLTDSPSFLKPNLQVPPKPSRADLRIRSAEERFQYGKGRYLAGDVAGARYAFDKALDLLLSTPEDV